jgi:hypothetical protein
VGKNFEDAPDYVWWVPHVLNKHSHIKAAITKRYQKRTHKFGIEVPKSWDDCIRLDKENDNTLWQDTVRKEMNNVRISFKILNDDDAIPPTYQEIRCHMIFDVNMEDFRRKARFVAGGHTTDTPHAMTYASVMSRESVIIALTLAALNDFNVKLADIENAYLTAPITEKIWNVLGPEFDDDNVKLLPLPHPPVRTRTDARTNPSAQRATQLRSVLARVYAVSMQNQITTTVP